MLHKLSIAWIVADHIRTLRRYDTGKPSYSDLIVFFGLPLVFAVWLVYLGLTPSDEVIGVLVTALSIFAALLFNLLLLVYDIVKKREAATDDLKIKVLQEVYSNISFGILISVITVMLLLSYVLEAIWPVLESVRDLSVFYLVLVFLLTLFMILKRVYLLLAQEFAAK